MNKNLIISSLCLAFVVCGCRSDRSAMPINNNAKPVDPSKIISSKKAMPLWLKDLGKYNVLNKGKYFVVGESMISPSIPMARESAKENANAMRDLEGDLIEQDSFLRMRPDGKYEIAILFRIQKRAEEKIETTTTPVKIKNRFSRENNSSIDVIQPKKHRYINPAAKRFSKE